MKHILIYILLFVLFPFCSFSQTTDTIGKIRYSSDFVFNDGIYSTFQEFKNDNPSITRFTVKNPSLFAEPNYKILEYICPDSIKKPGNCEVNDAWGYSYQGSVYVAHSYYAYYFKLIAVGSLCYFYGLSGAGTVVPANDVMMGFGANTEYQQFMIDYETGEIIPFNYKNFSSFLKTHDEDLYNDLMKQNKKKKVIFKYLLNYNERHPIWFKRS
jgi:hypothetical protein